MEQALNRLRRNEIYWDTITLSMASESRGDREMVAVMGENLAKDRPSRIEECNSHSF